MKKQYLTLILINLMFLGGLPVEGAPPVLLFGPQEYTQTNGGLEELTASFENCESNSEYRLVIENGNSDGTDRVSSGIVTLNGENIVRQNEFNQKVGTIEKRVGVLPNHNILKVRLTSKWGRSISIRIECVSNCLSIHFTSPEAASKINLPSVAAFGTLTSSSGQVGVVINGLTAFVYEDRFTANRIPLGLGLNTLVAAISNACGMRTEATLIITADGIEDPPVQIIPFPTSGIAPFTTKLESISQITTPIATYQWDFDGDGVNDTEGRDLSETIHTYTQPGFYRPTLTLVDVQGNSYSDQIGIVVVTRSGIDTLLTKKWDEMKDLLSKGNIEGAMHYFAEGSSKAMFRKNFTLMKDHLPQIVLDMGPIVFESIAGNGDVAFYTMKGIQGEVSRTFQIQFQKDHDGIWRIKFF